MHEIKETGILKTESNAAVSAGQFVKYILPYGPDNRENDKYRSENFSSEEVGRQFSKVYEQLVKEVGRYTCVQNLHHILIQAKIAIKYGAGNCEQQSAIAFVFLLARGIFEVSRVAVSKRDRGDHVFLEFIDPDSAALFALDPWDDNTIYSMTERENRKESSHTGIRAWPREIVSSRGAGFSFNQFNELLEIKSLNDSGQKQAETQNFEEEYLSCTHEEREYLFSCKKLALYFKTFLMQCVKQSTVLKEPEKLEAVKKIGGTLEEWTNLANKKSSSFSWPTVFSKRETSEKSLLLKAHQRNGSQEESDKTTSTCSNCCVS